MYDESFLVSIKKKKSILYLIPATFPEEISFSDDTMYINANLKLKLDSGGKWG